ncbi:MAG: hypothetical protein LBK91_02940 [Synergistaceae bacterium]|jgi:hypothetical protein|nr:hypothetical protein [Synergistaceae bacterium]
MADFDAALDGAAAAILKRPLTDEERAEFRDLAGTIGMGSVEDYLYMLMAFKRSEDRIRAGMADFENEMKARFGEMSALEKNINGTLETAIERILGEGAKRIGAEMGHSVAEGAKEILSSCGEYHFLRGQVWIVCLTGILSAVAYWLGLVSALRNGEGFWLLETMIMLPSGWAVFVCGAMYAYMWAFDNWSRVKESRFYQGVLALMGIAIFALFGFMAWMGSRP